MRKSGFIWSLLGFVFLACSGGKVTVVRASSRTWSGGAAGSAHGIDYSLEMKKPTKSTVTVDSLFQGDSKGGYWLQVTLFSDSLRTPIQGKTLDKGLSQFWIKGTLRYPGQRQNEPEPMGPQAVPTPKNIPLDFQQGLLLFFSVDNKSQTPLPISNVQEIEPLRFP